MSETEKTLREILAATTDGAALDRAELQLLHYAAQGWLSETGLEQLSLLLSEVRKSKRRKERELQSDFHR